MESQQTRRTTHGANEVNAQQLTGCADGSQAAARQATDSTLPQKEAVRAQQGWAKRNACRSSINRAK
jgi:hypothetical protein